MLFDQMLLLVFRPNVVRPKGFRPTDIAPNENYIHADKALNSTKSYHKADISNFDCLQRLENFFLCFSSQKSRKMFVIVLKRPFDGIGASR
jgi:hypothetical protein